LAGDRVNASAISSPLMEATIILAMISQRYRLDLVTDHPVEPYALITLRPRYGVKMTVQPAS
jgi:enediyne biosynthesis protein E7